MQPVRFVVGPVVGLALLVLALALSLPGGLVRAQAARPESPFISAGAEHTCALTPSGAADCWGLDSDGQATDQPGPFSAYVPPPSTPTAQPGTRHRVFVPLTPRP